MRFGNVTILAVCFALSLAGVAQGSPKAEGKLSLWYRQPASVWTEALPIGNGRLGAMVFGGTENERIQLNEGTLWAAGPYDPSCAAALEALPEARRLIFAGKYGEAHNLIGEKMMARPLQQMPYEPVGDLTLNFPGHWDGERLPARTRSRHGDGERPLHRQRR